jgi:hypothetical protein
MRAHRIAASIGIPANLSAIAANLSVIPANLFAIAADLFVIPAKAGIQRLLARSQKAGFRHWPE